LANDAFSACCLALVSSSSVFFLAVVPDPAHGHEQRNEPALADAPDHFLAGAKQRRRAVAREFVEIVEHRTPALDREQIAEGQRAEFGGVVAEQGLGAAVR
jgi:hypothetical protein